LRLSVISTPVAVGIRVSDGIESRGSAINHIPESSVCKDKGNHLVSVYVVVPIIIKEWDLVLGLLRLWLNKCDGGDNSRLRRVSMVSLQGSIVCLCARARRGISLA
jgi:hypothetical protein